jgi:hypothetical protein
VDKHCINCKYKYIQPDKTPCCLCLTAEDYVNNRHSYWVLEETTEETEGNERKTESGY